jgi:hypothetical protein
MHHDQIFDLIGHFTLTALLGAALAADPISERDAHAMGVAACLYFYWNSTHKGSLRHERPR